MSRNDFGQYAKAPSKKIILATFFGSLLSLGLLYAAALAVWSNFGSFKSCNANNNGITLTDCGKHGLNLGDVILLGLFVLVACMTYSLCTHLYRMLKRTTAK